jgi:hypothetical protein
VIAPVFLLAVQSTPLSPTVSYKVIEMADIWKILTTILFKICPTPVDVGTDLMNGVNLIANGSPIWGSLCLGLTMIPGIVAGVGWFVYFRTWGAFLRCVLLCLFGWILVPLMTVYG